jgi:hypothetical protein
VETVRELSDEHAARPACSKAEERVARWCARQLGDLGYDVTVERFVAREAKPWHAGFFGLAALGALAIGILPLAGFVVGVVALVLYARDLEGRPLVRLPSGESRNVVGRTPGRPDLVIVAHLDSGRAPSKRRVHLLATHGVLLLTPLAAAVAWVAGDEVFAPRMRWITAALLATSLILVTMFEMWSTSRVGSGSRGDNAGGIGVALRLAARRPAGVWFVFTGAKESGMFGIQAFLDSYAHDVAAARFLNFDCVMGDAVVAAWEEGVLRPHEADAVLLSAAEAAGIEASAFRDRPTDGTALLARRMKALSLVGPHGDEDIDRPGLDRVEQAARRIVQSALDVNATR